MKYANGIVLLVVLLVTTLVAGCDFLEAQPKSFVTSSRFYQTPEQVESAVNGIYAELQNVYDAGSGNFFWTATEMRSDNTTFQFNAADRGSDDMENLDEFQVTPANRALENLWTSLYFGIQQSNTVLNRIDGVEFTEQAKKDQYVGEAKFLRAFFYYHLVRLWGGVPLILKEVDSPDEAFSEGRASVEEVYAQIIKDAADAAKKLPASYPSGETGRVTKGAAHTLLAQIYMTRKDYQKAIEQLQQVTNMDYALLPDYADVFDPNRANSEESIFEIQYQTGIANGGEASEWIYHFVPFNSGTDIIPYPDLGPAAAGYNIPTVDLLRAYEEGDERKEASIAFYVNEENSQYDLVAIGDSIPFIKKYYHPFPEQHQTRENWPVYRYAHVLLMMAEALNEVGRTGEAYAYLNRVRERAGLEPLSGLSQEEFREAVYHEMRVELAFENHRWYILKRRGRAVEVMRKHGREMIERGTRITDAFYQIEEYKLLYPIPLREMRLNNFKQNPGW